MSRGCSAPAFPVPAHTTPYNPHPVMQSKPGTPESVPPPLPSAPVSERLADLRRFWLAFAAIAAVGAALRIFVGAEYLIKDPLSAYPIVDALTYWNWAGRIAAGQLSDGQPFFSAPLYPYLLGLIRACGGNLAAVYAVQILLDLTTAGLLAWIGRRRWGNAVGLLAAALYLLMFEPASECLRVLSSTVQLTLVALAWLAWVTAQRTFSLPYGLLAGAALGLLALAYPPAIVLLPVFGLWWLWNKGLSLGSVARAVAAVLAGLVVISPATIHNYWVCGEFIPISAQAGVTFAQGNTPGAVGTYTALPGVSMDREVQNRDAFRLYREATGQRPTWRSVNRYFFQRGFDYWRSDPPATTKLLALKAYWFLTGHHYGDIYVPSAEVAEGFLSRLRLIPLHTGWLIPPALLALAVLALRPRTYLPELVLLGLPLAVVVAFWFSPRYRLPAVPVVVLAAAWALSQMVQWRRHLAWSIAVPLTVALGVGLGLVNQATDFDRVEPRRVPLYVGLGWAMSEAGQLDDAVMWYQKARELDPNYPTLAANLGGLLMQLGRADAALPYLQEAVRAEPQNVEAHNALAGVLIGNDRLDEALEHVQTAVRLRPDSADLHFNLALVLLRKDDFEGAIAQLREAARLDPTSSRTQVQISQLLYATGDAPGAIAALRKAHALAPDNPEIATDLAWYLATTPNLPSEDRAAALKIAQQVVATGRVTPILLDTLAAALAANEMYPEAVVVIQRAIAAAEQLRATPLLPALQQRLALYAAEKPYVVPLTGTEP